MSVYWRNSVKTKMSQQNLTDFAVVLYIKYSVAYFNSSHNSEDK